MDSRESDLETAVRVLAALVREEYPDRYSLEEIAATWGDRLLPDEVKALARVEQRLFGEAD